jgi:galactokinase/mevalonate kinase-like predicted kinase
LIYCETDRQHAVRHALEQLGGSVTDFTFEKRGVQVWRSQNR